MSNGPHYREQAANLIGRCLYAALKDAGITQAELAHRTGLSRSRISQCVNSRQPCSVARLIELLEGCGLQIAELRCTKNGTHACVVLKNE